MGYYNQWEFLRAASISGPKVSRISQSYLANNAGGCINVVFMKFNVYKLTSVIGLVGHWVDWAYHHWYLYVFKKNVGGCSISRN